MFNSTSLSMQKSEKLKCLISYPFNYPNFQNAYALLSSSNLNWQNKVKLFTRILNDTNLYSNVCPGSIGQCDIMLDPSIHGVPRCNIPCQ